MTPLARVATHSHLDVLSRLLASRAVLALEEGLTVLVELERGDDDVGRGDTDGDGGTGTLLAVNAVDVDDPLLAVNLGDLALTALVCAADNLDLVILANRDRAGLLLQERRRGEWKQDETSKDNRRVSTCS